MSSNIDFLFVLLQVFDHLGVTKCRDGVLLPDPLVWLSDREAALWVMEDFVATHIDRCVRRDRRLDADQEAIADLQFMHRNIVD